MSFSFSPISESRGDVGTTRQLIHNNGLDFSVRIPLWPFRCVTNALQMLSTAINLLKKGERRGLPVVDFGDFIWLRVCYYFLLSDLFPQQVRQSSNIN